MSVDTACERPAVRWIGCAAALAFALIPLATEAQERDASTPPAGGVPDPDGPVTADELARGDVNVEGVPVHDNPFRVFGVTDRLEYQSNDGEAKYVWDAFAYAGGDYHRLWVESEGEGLFDGDVEAAELQVLYSRAITPYWNAQIGLRHDFRPEPETDYLVIGAEGLNVFWTGISADLFVSEEGDVSSALEIEFDELLTQRLKLQPRFEVGIQFQDVEEANLGAGITNYEAGLRLRYEIVREFAPYVGVSWAQTVGETADLLPDDEEAGTLSVVAGVRAWL